jgi:hypothetical protein
MVQSTLRCFAPSYPPPLRLLGYSPTFGFNLTCQSAAGRCKVGPAFGDALIES